MGERDDEAIIDELLETWFSRRHAGQAVDIDELCAAAPHLREDLSRSIARHMALIAPAIAPPPTGMPVEIAPRHLERIGDYRIKSRIGRGGMSEVFLARQESLDRLVAIKVLHAAYADDAAYRLRFRREAEIAGALDHPHIVPIYETGEHEGLLFLVMKLIDGVPIDLADGIGEPRRLAAIGAQVARALHAAHEIGIIHRDVKPGNVLVVDAHAYVVDFGLARSRADVTLTRPGQSPGTLQFMAPEQIRGGPPSVDPRVDVYGLGATLFACLHGAPPFDSSDAQTLLRQILFDDPPHRAVSGRARDLDVIVRRALAKEPQRRFANMIEFAADLDNLAADRPIASRPVGLLERAAVRARRHPRTAAALAFAAAISLALAFLLWAGAREVEARYRGQLDLADAELADDRPSRALARLEELPAARQAAVEVEQRSRAAKTRLSLAALLDQLQAERRFRDTRWLRELEAELLAGDPVVVAGKPAWIAQLLLAVYDDRPERVGQLLADPRAAAFPRTSAMCAAAPGDAEIALRGAGDAAVPADGALDAVAVSTLLRSREADPVLIAAELRRPVFPTPRLLFGQAMLALIAHRDADAAQWLGAVVADDRPHPEARMSLARIAGRAGRLEAAREQLRLARTELAIVRRATPLRLEITVAEIELMHGNLEVCRAALARALQTWPDRPELLLIESQVAVFDGQFERALELSSRACELDPLPWTWRRAAAHQLALRAQRLDMNDPPAAELEAVRTAAVTLRDRSRAAFDRYHEARAENVLAYTMTDPEQYLAGLERVLELVPGDPTASAQFIEQVHGAWRAGVALGDLPRARARRAVELAEGLVARHAAEPRCLARPQLLASALGGARLAVLLGEVGRADRLGTALSEWLRQQPDQQVQQQLDALREELRGEYGSGGR